MLAWSAPGKIHEGTQIADAHIPYRFIIRQDGNIDFGALDAWQTFLVDHDQSGRQTFNIDRHIIIGNRPIRILRVGYEHPQRKCQDERQQET
jgi:hypothetical protein